MWLEFLSTVVTTVSSLIVFFMVSSFSGRLERLVVLINGNHKN